MNFARRSWWAAAVLAAGLAAPAAAQESGIVAPAAGQESRPLARGLILGSVEAAIAAPAERYDDFAITVDLSDRTLYVLSGDEVVKSYPVAVGLASYPTPRGDFSIRKMIWNPDWRPPPSDWARDKTYEAPGSPGNPMGRVKIFFQEPDYYIHGTGLTGSLGNARSHGCIRMRNIDAVELARLVMINAGENRPQEWYEETVARRETLREVQLKRSVRFKVRA